MKTKVTPTETGINETLAFSNKNLKEKIAELDQSLIEKDVLLHEVHHRVNNNLAVIASLLRMQSDAVPDDGVAEALRATYFRVESMALIHAHLHNAADWRSVNFSQYVAVLAENLFRSYGIDDSRISLRLEIGPFELSVDRAIPAGLILNELISNALKHAFPAGRRGSILIEGLVRGDRIELSVRDDGAGIKTTKESTEPRKRKSLGLKIVNILCRQLKGTLMQHQASDEGATYGISFPMESAASGRQ
jgi:two-component sensor histidine kinase